LIQTVPALIFLARARAVEMSLVQMPALSCCRPLGGPGLRRWQVPGWLWQREVRLDLVAAAAAVFVLDDVPGCCQVGGDGVGAAVGGARCAIIRIDAFSSGDRKGPFELQIVYGIGGERELTERTLDHLA
jgi:hypothetical protein